MSSLREVDDCVWSMAIPLRFWGVETGARMTIVRLRSGDLFVHSPLPLDETLKRQIDALGPVTAVVAPSLFHHMSVSPWKEVYPGALFACCPGLERKRADFPWDVVLSDRPEPGWSDDLDQVHFGARMLESEVVFFHSATRTMICADAIFNLRNHSNWGTRIAAFLLGINKPGATWLERMMIRDRSAAREQIDRMLAWKPERIVLAHGPCIERGGESVLREAYAWLLDTREAHHEGSANR